jgi:hypothetical protein
MTHELVLQWPASSIDDYDVMVDMEEELIEKLSAGSKVDGHDAGSGEVNIFIHTDDPERAFQEVKSFLSRHPGWSGVRAAHRNFEAEDYTIIWPVGLREFDII